MRMMGVTGGVSSAGAPSVPQHLSVNKLSKYWVFVIVDTKRDSILLTYLFQGHVVGGSSLSSTLPFCCLGGAPSRLGGWRQITFWAMQEASHQNSSYLKDRNIIIKITELCPLKILQNVSSMFTLRSARERWQSLGNRSGEVAAGLGGTSIPVVADFMLLFVDSTAARGRDVWGSRHASDDGPLNQKIEWKWFILLQLVYIENVK